MDILTGIVILGVVVLVAYVLFGKSSGKSKIDKIIDDNVSVDQQVTDIRSKGSKIDKIIDDNVSVDQKVKPAKKAPAKKKAADKKAPAKAKLPSDAQLQKNTKGQLEELGRKHSIELDKRLTKAKMIAELKKQFKTKQK